MPVESPPIEPFAPGYEADPYPTLAWLREKRPVYEMAFPFSGHPVWLVTRYEDVLAVLSGPEFGCDSARWADPAVRESGLLLFDDSDLTPTMNMMDPPEHTRLRQSIGQGFTARRVAAMRPVIERAVDGALLQMAAAECDLLEVLAARVAVVTLCEFIGVPEEDRLDLRQWVDRVLSILPTERTDLAEAIGVLEAYFDDLVRRKRESPGDDLVSDLVHGRGGGAPLPSHEIKPMVFLLLAAGLEGAMNLIGNAVLTLLDHPDQLDGLRARPALLDSAIEEVLRYECPAASPLWRFAKRTTVLSGTTIPAGGMVVASLNSANRDPSRFHEPDRFDISRGSTHHLAFGHGRHQCMGAALVRLAGRTAVGRVISAFPDLRLAVPRSQVRFQPEILVRGLYSLPIRTGASPTG